jgi:hypothetical protein
MEKLHPHRAGPSKLKVTAAARRHRGADTRVRLAVPARIAHSKRDDALQNRSAPATGWIDWAEQLGAPSHHAIPEGYARE